MLRPVGREPGLQRPPRLTEEPARRREESLRNGVARRVRHREEPEEPGAGRIPHRFEVRVLVRLEDRADRDALRKVLVLVAHDAHQDLGVRPHEVAEAFRQVREAVRALLQPQEELDRPEDPAREDDVLRGHPRALPQERERLAPAADRQLVAAVRKRLHPRDLGVGLDARALLLGEPEVVLVERVLRVVAAADHAAAAGRAARARGPLAAEVRVRHGHAGLPEVHGHVRGLPLVDEPEIASHGAQDLVRRGRERHPRRPEHPLRRGVVRRQLGLPVREGRPARRREEGIPRHRQRVRVDEGAAADADARECRDVLQERHLEEAAESHSRQPQPLREVPVRLREVLRGEARALLEHDDALALLGEAQGRHAPSEAGADDREVRVEFARHAASLAPGRGAEIGSLLRVDGAAQGDGAGDFFE